MYPRLFTLPVFEVFGRQIGPLSLPTYGVLLAIGFIAGLWIASVQARKAGINPDRISDMGVYVLLAGLLGAKLMLLVVGWRQYLANPREIWSILQSGGVFYGGLLGALPVAWWYARRHQLDLWITADVLAPGVILGQAIGRLGCFAAGCCYGRPTDVPWAVVFRDIYAYRQVGTPLDTPVHPSQIYESLAAILILLLLLFISARKRFHGQVVLSYVMIYAVTRFTLEFFRGDQDRGTVFGVLSTSQFIAAGMLLAASLALPYVMKHRRITPQAPPATA